MRRVVEVYIGSANHAWLMGLGGVCGVESMVLLLGSRYTKGPGQSLENLDKETRNDIRSSLIFVACSNPLRIVSLTLSIVMKVFRCVLLCFCKDEL